MASSSEPVQTSPTEMGLIQGTTISFRDVRQSIRRPSHTHAGIASRTAALYRGLAYGGTAEDCRGNRAVYGNMMSGRKPAFPRNEIFGSGAGEFGRAEDKENASVFGGTTR